MKLTGSGAVPPKPIRTMSACVVSGMTIVISAAALLLLWCTQLSMVTYLTFDLIFYLLDSATAIHFGGRDIRRVNKKDHHPPTLGVVSINFRRHLSKKAAHISL